MFDFLKSLPSDVSVIASNAAMLGGVSYTAPVPCFICSSLGPASPRINLFPNARVFFFILILCILYTRTEILSLRVPVECLTSICYACEGAFSFFNLVLKVANLQDISFFCRVMADELTNARAILQRQTRDAQSAIQDLLSERDQFRQEMIDAQKCEKIFHIF